MLDVKVVIYSGRGEVRERKVPRSALHQSHWLYSCTDFNNTTIRTAYAVMISKIIKAHIPASNCYDAVTH